MNSGAAATFNGAITLGSASSIGTTGNITLGGGITGGQDLTKVGAEILNLGSSTATLNSLTISAGTLTSTSGNLNVAGNFTNSSTFTHNSGTVTFNGSGAQLINSGGSSFNNLTITNTGGTCTASSNGINVSNTLTTNASTVLDMATYALGGTLSGITNNGKIKTACISSPLPSGRTWGGEIEYYGAGGQTVSGGTYSTCSTTTAGNYAADGNITGSTLFDNGGSSNVAAVLDMGSTYTLSGNIGNNGATIRFGGNNGIAGFSSGTIEYYGVTQNITSGAYATLNITAAGTKTAGGAISVSTYLDNGGSSDVAAILDMDGYPLTGAATIDNTGATVRFNGGSNGKAISTGTVEYYGTTQTVTSGTYSTLNITATGTKTAGGTVTASTLDNGGVSNVAAILDMDGYNLTATTIDNTGATIRFNGASNGLAIPTGTVEYYGTSQTVALGIYENLKFSNTTGTTNYAGGNITVNGDLSWSTGNFAIGDDNTLTLAGTVTPGTGYLYGGSSSNLTVNGTGSNISLPGSVDELAYLTLDRTGGLTLVGELRIYNDIILTNGALSLGNNALYIDGDINNDGGGTINGNGGSTTTSTIIVEGTAGNLSLPAINGGLYQLNLDRSNGMTLEASLTVEHALILTSGALSIGSSHTLGINGGLTVTSGTITGSSTSSIAVGCTSCSSALTLPAITNGLYDLSLNRSYGMTLDGSLTTLSNDLILTSGALTLNPGKDLTVANNTYLNSAQCLVLVSNSGGTASFITNTVSGSGTARAQRYLTTGKWHYLSIPVSSATAGVFHLPAGQSDIYLAKFTPTIANGGQTVYYYPCWEFITNVSTELNPNQGYAVWPSSESGGVEQYLTSATINFTSSLNTGSSITCYNSDETHGNGYYFVGNPFTSAIDRDVGTWSMTDLDGSVHVYHGTGFYYRNGSGEGSLTNGIIPAAQGFFVQFTTPASSGSTVFSIPTAAKVHDAQAYYKSEDKRPDLIDLKITSDVNSYSDEAFVYFDSTCTYGTDVNHDVGKMFGIVAAPDIYSVTGGVRRSISALPLFGNSVEIQLGFRVGINGTYHITTTELNSFPEGTSIYLEDQQNQVFHNLNESNVYTFTATTNDSPLRFRLHFNSLITSADELNEEMFNIYTNGIDIYLFCPENVKEIRVFDMLGQEVMYNKSDGNRLHKLEFSHAQGLYVVKALTGTRVFSKKVLFN
jgi:hypothetical protein